MKFGFMEDFRNPKEWRRPFPELYKAILDQIVRCEELGYDNAWLTEHHFTEDGYNPSTVSDGSCGGRAHQPHPHWDVYLVVTIPTSGACG